jgi:Flp pilus assembly protein TadG
MTQIAKFTAFGRDARGAAAIEFAIIAPLLFAMLFGVFEIGRLMYEQSRAAAAAAAGARAAAVYSAEDDDDVEAAVEAAVEARYPSNMISNLDVVVTPQTFGTQAFRRIDVTFDFDFLIHFSKDWNGVTITATRYAPDFS